MPRSLAEYTVYHSFLETYIALISGVAILLLLPLSC